MVPSHALLCPAIPTHLIELIGSFSSPTETEIIVLQLKTNRICRAGGPPGPEL